jgi:hypothetical protein
MPEQFKQGDTVEFDDAYTGELTYGRVSRVYGSDVMVSKISKEEAGPKPKRFNAQPGCSYGVDENRIPNAPGNILPGSTAPTPSPEWLS